MIFVLKKNGPRWAEIGLIVDSVGSRIISLSRYQPINIDVIVVSDDITTRNHCPRSTYSRVKSILPQPFWGVQTFV